jgi:hypothetical protein
MTTQESALDTELDALFLLVKEIAEQDQGEVGAVLAKLKTVRDLRSRLSDADALLGTVNQGLEKKLLDYHESSGLESLSGGGLSVSFDDSAMRAKYEPDKWPQLLAWAAQTGNEHIIQRRLTDSRVLDLVKSGVALPEGLGLESYVKISIRKKS